MSNSTQNNLDSLATDWQISNDIYDIVESVNNLQKRYIMDEQESTLALGIFGFLADTEAKKIQTAVVMTGKMGNEMFPTRAQLTKNVLTHAIYNNIPNINAVPAYIILNIGIAIKDIEKYGTNDRFILDKDAPIFIGNYEFHFDYDVLIRRNKITDSSVEEGYSYSYSAQYDMEEENRVSDITNQYLRQPFTVKLNNADYLIIQSVVRQYTITTITDKITSSSLVENKTYMFEFPNQLVDFDVYVTDSTGNEIRLVPLLYGQNTETLSNYCWYLPIDDNTIRVTFDSRSLVPALNSNIRIRVYSTLGENGNFRYTKAIDKTSEGFFVDFNSKNYNYKITTYNVAITDSINGKDRKSKKELQELIPKAAMSRGSITTETDVDNYFNLINDDKYRLVLSKKVDNQLNRIWYGYFLLKDEENNIIPTNTIDIKIENTDKYILLDNHGKYILPAGSVIRYNKDDMVGEIVDESSVPEPYTEEYFNNEFYYYYTIYNTIITPSPLFSGYTSTIIDKDSWFKFDWVNNNAPLQFVANRCNFRRKMLEEQSKYRLEFAIAQSILASNYITYSTEDSVTSSGEILRTTTCNVKTILVLYNDNDEPYRWVECKFNRCDDANKIFYFYADLKTDNMLDDSNKLKLISSPNFPLMVAGYAESENYGYFPGTVKAKLYVLTKFELASEYSVSAINFGRGDLDDIAPVYPNYSVTNVYEINDGLQIYEQFTEVVNTKIDIVDSHRDPYNVQQITYGIVGVPVVGYHYAYRGEEYVNYLFDAIYERKNYIDYCLTLLENNMNIDFKFFNTYGPSSIYYIGDAKKTMIGHVDLCMKFRLSMMKTTDINTKNDIMESIKSYIENLYDTGNWDAPTMITTIMNEYSDRINFIEYMNFNDFWLGVQHIWKLEDVESSPLVVPEFLNIRNTMNADGNLVPDIEIEII